MEKLRFAALLFAILTTLVSLPFGASAQVGTAALAAGSIGNFIDGLKSTVKQLEDSAHSLIDHGNTSLGQQQMVLAGILTKLIEQLSTAYGNALDKTFTEISSAERDTFSAIAQNISDVDRLRSITFENVQEVIYKTQGATNQIIDRLPLANRYPIYYGLAVRDLTTDPAPSPADIEILGFHFADPNLEFKAPKIIVAGMEVRDADVSVQQDRIKVQLSDVIKSKVGFNSSPCSPRSTFPIDIIVTYGIKRGVWPIYWTSRRESKFHANALAGADRYDVKVRYAATRTSKPLIGHLFSARSGYTAMGCEQTTSASVRFDLPPGSQERSCSAVWVNTSNVGSSSQNCTVGGTVASGSGSMRGRDKQCIKVPPFGPTICNCPGGGHGELQISGNYKVVEPKMENMSEIPLSSVTMVGQSDIFTPFPVDDNLQITKVDVDVYRKSCSTPKDRISINVPDWKHRFEAASQEGLFRAIVWNGQLTVSKR